MKPGPSPARLYSLLLIMVFFWAVSFVAGKIALREIPAMVLPALRMALAAIFLLPVYWWDGRNHVEPRWTKSDLPTLIVLSLLGVALNQIFYLASLSRTSVGHSSLIIGLTPILVLAIAAFVGQEIVTSRRVLGMTIALGGVIVLQAGKSAGSTILGDLLALGAAITFAGFSVLGRRVSGQHSPITVITFLYVLGTLFLIPVAWFSWGSFSLQSVSALVWWNVAYMALFPSVISYLIFYWALRHMPASRVTSLGYLQPLIATATAILVIGEPVTTALVSGGLLVLFGVGVAERT